MKAENKVSAALKEVQFANSYTRLPSLLRLHDVMGDTPDFWKLFGRYWSGCDNFVTYDADVFDLLTQCKYVTHMMTAEELAYLNALPGEVTIYRGTRKSADYGLSWSLKREVAERFPFLNRYRADIPVLRTMVVPKSEVVAVKLDRDEFEVITCWMGEYEEVEL